MTGKYNIIVKNSKIQFSLDIERNITVICGDSGKGKTTLIELLQNYEMYGSQSGVTVQCKKPCKVVEGNNWRIIIENTENSIIFIDEGNSFLRSKDFADVVKRSDNYFVLITRESLHQLPYSVNSVLKMEKTRKIKKKTYNKTYPVYENIPFLEKETIKQYTFLTEDKGSGFQMFSYIASQRGSACISADGKSNIAAAIYNSCYNKLLVIADGAAFGSEMEKVSKMVSEDPDNIFLYLPESFEWIILKSGIVPDDKILKILKKPYEYIDSKQFESWEQYFYFLLKETTKNSYLQYDKDELSKSYFQDKHVRKIIYVMTGKSGE